MPCNHFRSLGTILIVASTKERLQQVGCSIPADLKWCGQLNAGEDLEQRGDNGCKVIIICEGESERTRSQWCSRLRCPKTSNEELFVFAIDQFSISLRAAPRNFATRPGFSAAVNNLAGVSHILYRSLLYLLINTAPSQLLRCIEARGLDSLDSLARAAIVNVFLKNRISSLAGMFGIGERQLRRRYSQRASLCGISDVGSESMHIVRQDDAIRHLLRWGRLAVATHFISSGACGSEKAAYIAGFKSFNSFRMSFVRATGAPLGAFPRRELDRIILAGRPRW